MGLAALVPATRPLDNRRTVVYESMPLFEQIDALLAEPAPREPDELARLERTLTDGYAHALSLEAEQLRLQRRMTELAGELHDGNQEQKAEELVQVSRRLSDARSELESLRATLIQLRLLVRTARR